MRDYAKVSPQFWTGKTGKALKAAGHEAVIVGMYLMTSPHANMIGLYHCPLVYIAHDTGLGFEGASKGLASAIEAGFCTFEADSDYVFVHEFAAYQIGDELEAKDNRVKGVANELAKIPKGQCWQGFVKRYGSAFHLPDTPKKASPSKAPPKPEAGAGEEKDGFALFWTTWPNNDRKGGKAKCLELWKRGRLEDDAARILAHVEAMKATPKWREAGGEFVPMPLTYLNGRRWDGAELDLNGSQAGLMAGAV
jgi:hypothetical protein